jgi:DNA processing protein
MTVRPGAFDNQRMREDLDELAAWLRLTLIRDFGRAQARECLTRFGPPTALFAQGADAWRAFGGPSLVDKLATPPPDFDAAWQALRAWLEQDAAREVIALDDPRFPKRLLDTADPPLMLYAQGRIELLESDASVAIVGSRNPTAQGLDNARAFARVLASRGFTIVSGLALGVDGAAHEGALQAGGDTIAVVGTGLDRTYPARHQALAREIATRGLLLGEYPLGTPPLRDNFPRRNRIIAGLGDGTLVVEAAMASGSLVTARQAAECGREVFAIPGSIHSPQSHGCHALIKLGAKLVEDADDVVAELQPRTGTSTSKKPVKAAAANASADASGDDAPMPHDDEGLEPEPSTARGSDREQLLDALGHEPSTLDALIDRTGWPTPVAQARLLELELEGLVQRLPGGRFQRRAAA